MDSLTFIKSSVTNELISSINTIEDARLLTKNFLNEENLHSENLISLINRKEYIKEIFDALNSPIQKLIMIGGFQGTGKTELIRTSTLFLDENVLNFYYECSAITNLDDIILSLFGFLNKQSDQSLSRSNKGLIKQSIDERLINYLKNLQRPLLIIIDGFEYLIKENEIKDNELVQFLDFILMLPHVKMIIAGKQLPSNFSIKEEKVLKIILSGLDENEVMRILKSKDIQGSEQVLYQIYQATRGYPESILWFINAVNSLNLSPFDLIKDYSGQKESFEEHIQKKICSNIPATLKKLVWFLTLIRHPLAKSSINSLNLVPEVEESLNYLSFRMIVCLNKESYCIKGNLKKIIYNNIPDFERLKIHRFLHELYTEQIPKKPEERIIKISRKLLHFEQYYHYICSMKLEKDHDSSGHKYRFDSNFLATYIKDAQEYLPIGMIDSIFWSGGKSGKDSKGEDKNGKDDEEKIETDISDIKQPQSLMEFPVDTPYDEKINTEAIHIDESDFNIRLSEEEKSLLKEDMSERKTQPEIALSILKKPEEIPFENPADALIADANRHENNGSYDLALIDYNKAYEIILDKNDSTTIADISLAIGKVLHNLQKYDQAIEYINRSLEIYIELNDKNKIYSALLSMANVYNDSYKHDSAMNSYYKILDSAYGEVQEEFTITALAGIGDMYDYRNEFDDALNYYLKALNKSEELNDINNVSELCFKIALIYDDLDDSDKAVEYYFRSIEVNKNHETNAYLASSYANIAAIYDEKDNRNLAIDYYEKSLDVDRQTQNYEGQYKTLSKLGNMYFEIGDLSQASEYFHEELAISKQTGDLYWIASSYLDIGDLYLTQKNHEKALKAFILARKNIGNTISTDSKEKIDRRFKQISAEIGENEFNAIINTLRKKNG